MERENYIESLRNMTIDDGHWKQRSISPDIIAHEYLRTISTQTNDGVWLETKNTAKTGSKRKRNHSSTVAEDVSNIKGTVYVDGRNLVSDGCGGYYVRVQLSDIRPISRQSNGYTHRNYQLSNTHNRQYPGGSYYSNQYYNSRPSPSETFYSNKSPYPNEYRSDRTNADNNYSTLIQKNMYHFDD